MVCVILMYKVGPYPKVLYFKDTYGKGPHLGKVGIDWHLNFAGYFESASNLSSIYEINEENS